MAPKENERDYIAWQNRAFRFYLGARVSFLNDLPAPAAFCGQQALESLLKATLVYWDSSFHPERIRHSFPKLLRTLRNKVRGATGLEVPKYFYFDKRYQATARYPTHGQGLVIPGSFLDDLDAAFSDLVFLVPFQFNSELKRLLLAPDSRPRRMLTRRNRRSRRLQRFLKVTRGSRRAA